MRHGHHVSHLCDESMYLECKCNDLTCNYHLSLDHSLRLGPENNVIQHRVPLIMAIVIILFTASVRSPKTTEASDPCTIS